MPITTEIKVTYMVRKLSRLVQDKLNRLRFGINCSAVILQWFLQKKKKKKILKTWRSNMIKSMAQIEQLLKPNSTVLSAQNK